MERWNKPSEEGRVYVRCGCWSDLKVTVNNGWYPENVVYPHAAGCINSNAGTDPRISQSHARILLTVAEEIANDPKCDLVYSERRMRLYSAITGAGGTL